MAAVFGADVPREAGPTFAQDVVRLLEELRCSHGSEILFEKPWMTFALRNEPKFHHYRAVSFENRWPGIPVNAQIVAALNTVDTVLIILPIATLHDFETGHRHSIVEQAVIAMGLKRRVASNNYTALGAFISRRLEESAQ